MFDKQFIKKNKFAIIILLLVGIYGIQQGWIIIPLFSFSTQSETIHKLGATTWQCPITLGENVVDYCSAHYVCAYKTTTASKTNPAIITVTIVNTFAFSQGSSGNIVSIEGNWKSWESSGWLDVKAGDTYSATCYVVNGEYLKSESEIIAYIYYSPKMCFADAQTQKCENNQRILEKCSSFKLSKEVLEDCGSAKTCLISGSGFTTCQLKPPCQPSWSCGSWSSCQNNIQSRTCNDGCGQTTVETQGCSMPTVQPEPTVSPQCSCPPMKDWGECTKDGLQYRLIYRCGFATEYKCKETYESQACTPTAEQTVARCLGTDVNKDGIDDICGTRISSYIPESSKQKFDSNILIYIFFGAIILLLLFA